MNAPVSFRDEDVNPYESPRSEQPIRAELADDSPEPSLTWLSVVIATASLVGIIAILAVFSTASVQGWGAK